MATDNISDAIKTSAEAYEASALPRARVSLACDQQIRTAEDEPLPKELAGQSIADKSAAQWAYERLILYIKNFESQLDNQHEVAMGFAGGEAGILRIEGVGYFDPDIVTFYGRDEDGARTQLIQHVTQLNVMLRALPKAPEVDEPRRIGFQLATGLGERPRKKKK